ncbi:hypothetical protein ACWBC2_10775 [Salegentibacter agarivorans]
MAKKQQTPNNKHQTTNTKPLTGLTENRRPATENRQPRTHPEQIATSANASSQMTKNIRVFVAKKQQTLNLEQ